MRTTPSHGDGSSWGSPREPVGECAPGEPSLRLPEEGIAALHAGKLPGAVRLPPVRLAFAVAANLRVPGSPAANWGSSRFGIPRRRQARRPGRLYDCLSTCRVPLRPTDCVKTLVEERPGIAMPGRATNEKPEQVAEGRLWSSEAQPRAVVSVRQSCSRTHG